MWHVVVNAPMHNLPFSQACENNQAPILAVLQRAFAKANTVLEIGAGTGQHSVFFAPQLPHLQWQSSDQSLHLPNINAWHAAYPAQNLPKALPLNVNDDVWPTGFDAAFSANTAHIMDWESVQRMFLRVGQGLPSQGVFALYGPFNYQGDYTSVSNRQFDAMLRQRDAKQGIRDFEKVNSLAEQAGLQLQEDNAMPANNRLLVWEKY